MAIYPLIQVVPNGHPGNHKSTQPCIGLRLPGHQWGVPWVTTNPFSLNTILPVKHLNSLSVFLSHHLIQIFLNGQRSWPLDLKGFIRCSELCSLQKFLKIKRLYFEEILDKLRAGQQGKPHRCAASHTGVQQATPVCSKPHRCAASHTGVQQATPVCSKPHRCASHTGVQQVTPVCSKPHWCAASHTGVQQATPVCSKPHRCAASHTGVQQATPGAASHTGVQQATPVCKPHWCAASHTGVQATLVCKPHWWVSFIEGQWLTSVQDCVCMFLIHDPSAHAAGGRCLNTNCYHTQTPIKQSWQTC